jgi:hypothetical protein
MIAFNHVEIIVGEFTPLPLDLAFSLFPFTG